MIINPNRIHFYFVHRLSEFFKSGQLFEVSRLQNRKRDRVKRRFRWPCTRIWNFPRYIGTRRAQGWDEGQCLHKSTGLRGYRLSVRQRKSVCYASCAEHGYVPCLAESRLKFNSNSPYVPVFTDFVVTVFHTIDTPFSLSVCSRTWHSKQPAN